MTNRYYVTFDPNDLTVTKVVLAQMQDNDVYEGHGYCYVRAADELGAFMVAMSKIGGSP